MELINGKYYLTVSEALELLDDIPDRKRSPYQVIFTTPNSHFSLWTGFPYQFVEMIAPEFNGIVMCRRPSSEGAAYVDSEMIWGVYWLTNKKCYEHASFKYKEDAMVFAYNDVEREKKT